MIPLDDLLTVLENGPKAQRPRISDRPSARGFFRPAFVLFTSGSTGQPKGVLLEHAGIVNMAMHCSRALGCGPADVHLQAATVSFDAMLGEFMVPLVLGGCMAILPPGAQLDPQAVVRCMSQHAVTTTVCVPSVMQAWLQAGLTESLCPCFRLAIVGGEVMTPTLINCMLAALPEATLINIYGPTEASLFVTQQGFSAREELHALPSSGRCPISPPPDPAPLIPIGCPISNVNIHILDQQQRPVPVRVAGEICISGVCLAHGYLNQDELTRSSFVANPICASGCHSRMYRTGDLGRWQHDGTLEILGRFDRQVMLHFSMAFACGKALLVNTTATSACLNTATQVPGATSATYSNGLYQRADSHSINAP